MAHAFKGEMFEKFPVESVPRNAFTLDTQRLFTHDFGELVPFFCHPVIGGETAKSDISMFVRMMPMTSPIMHQLDYSVFCFYVRNPILWDDWRDFIRGGDDGQTEIAPPNMFASLVNEKGFYVDDAVLGYEIFDLFNVDVNDESTYGNCLIGPGSVWDYMGFPTPNFELAKEAFDESQLELNTDFYYNFRPFDILPFKAYQAIYNEYFRDEYIDDKVDLFTGAGGDYAQQIYQGEANTINSNYRNYFSFDMVKELFKMRYRRYEKDPFTSALDRSIAVPDVKIPFNADVNLYANSDADNSFVSLGVVGTNYPGDDYFVLRSMSQTEADESFNNISKVVAQPFIDGEPISPAGDLYGSVKLVAGELNKSNYMSIANALSAEIANISATISQLRANVAMQEFLELSARAGNRYIELMKAHFNTIVPDYTLDRPQYLGGTKFTLGISQVLQTSATQGDSSSADFQPLGQMAGQGMSGTGDFLFKEKFYEHGWLIYIASVRPRTMYMQGMPSIFQKFNRDEYLWPKFANIGDQPVKNGEIFTDYFNLSKGYNPNGDFGYQTRYWEYKYIPSTVHGDFRTSLKEWHLAREFKEQPKLNSSFIQVGGKEDTSMNRIFAYQGNDYDHFLVQANIGLTMSRTLPVFSVPKFI